MKDFEDVTIGIPVYNESSYIEATIRSAANQCKILFVSDNCSCDESASICEELSRQYQNIRLFKQSKNIGAHDNFKYLLEKAETPYFMWLGGHDLLPDGYVRELKKKLDSDSSCVLAFSSALHVDENGNSKYRYHYDFASFLENNDPGVRLMSLLQKLCDCSLIHGLFRTSALKKAWIDTPYLGGDHVLLAKAVLLGRFLYSTKTEYIRRDPHISDSHSDQMVRIVGFLPVMSFTTYKNMQIEQFSMVSNFKSYRGLRKIHFYLKARFWLIYRFGIFGKNIIDKVVDFIILKSGSIALYSIRVMKQLTP